MNWSRSEPSKALFPAGEAGRIIWAQSSCCLLLAPWRLRLQTDVFLVPLHNLHRAEHRRWADVVEHVVVVVIVDVPGVVAIVVAVADLVAAVVAEVAAAAAAAFAGRP